MGRISGWLWIVGALVAVAGTFLPGASHKDIVWVMALSVLVLAYGVGSVTGLIPWEQGLDALAGARHGLHHPVVGLAIYLSGGSISYVEPLLFCSLLYAALFFPAALGLAALDRARRRRRGAARLRRRRHRHRLPLALPGPGGGLPRPHRGDGQPQAASGRGGGAPA